MQSGLFPAARSAATRSGYRLLSGQDQLTSWGHPAQCAPLYHCHSVCPDLSETLGETTQASQASSQHVLASAPSHVCRSVKLQRVTTAFSLSKQRGQTVLATSLRSVQRTGRGHAEAPLHLLCSASSATYCTWYDLCVFHTP